MLGLIIGTIVFMLITTVSIIHLAKIIRHMNDRLTDMEKDFAMLLGRKRHTKYDQDKDYL